MLGHEQHATSVEIVDHREVMMTAGERLLIYAQPGDRFSLAALQPTLHRPLLDGVHFVPAQIQPVGDRLLACRVEPVDGQRFEQSRETAAGFGPRKLHRSSAMFRADTGGRTGIDDRPQLAGVQMTPPPWRLMIVERTRRPAFRTRRLCPSIVAQTSI